MNSNGYISYKKIEMFFPYSEALYRAEYDAQLKTLSVEFESNKDMSYVHEDVDWDELNMFCDLVGSKKSGYRGYNEWKEMRASRFQDRDMQAFEDLWQGLNEYQRANLISFAGAKSSPLFKTPIKKWR